MIGYFFAVLAAAANAVASVLQRRAGKEEEGEEMSVRLIAELVRNPVWLLGILAVTGGFVLQAVALGYGQLATIEPILILELPLTIVLAWRFLGEPMGRQQAATIVLMTLGLAGLLFFLSPSGGHANAVPLWKWGVSLGAGYLAVGGLVCFGRRTQHDMARSAVYGAATGAGFGITAALMKGMTDAARHGFLHVFTAWQLYLMILTGALSMYLLQNAVAAGRLVAAQPGFTLTDPVVAILFGTLVFGEQVRSGLFLLLAVLSFALVVVSVVVLSQADEVKNAENASEGGSEDEGAYPQDASGEQRPAAVSGDG